jgi:nicotinamide mononucleotide (NMN) deamidase PncC
VGTVHLAVSGPEGAAVRSLRLPGDRDRVRQLTVTAALELLRKQLVADSVPLTADKPG